MQKKYEEEAKVSAATAKKLANPEVKLTKKTEQEVKKSGTKLQKRQWLFDTFLIHYKQPPYCNKPYDHQA
jgi:hypothetical protein